MPGFLGTLKLPLCSMQSFTSVDGACKGLIKHQMAGSFTMDIDEFGLGSNSP